MDVRSDILVSVVIPCRNEKNYIQRCLDSVLSSDYSGNMEILVVDGMSDDGTRTILQDLHRLDARIILLDNPKKDTPNALNIGIQFSKGNAILILGAHSELADNYISSMVQLLFSDETIGCVGGRTIPEAKGSALQIAIAEALKSRFGVGNSYYRVPGANIREVDTVAYGLYRREAIEKIGLLNTELIRNQDIEFNARLRRAGYRIVMDPRVFVYYHPRITFQSFCRQNYGNGFWNIITWKKAPGSLSWRHFVPLAFVLSLGICLLGSIWLSGFRWLLLLILLPYTLLDLVETTKCLIQRKNLNSIIISLIFPVLHISYGIGSLAGLFAQLRRSA